jgi:N-methylhydantoinase A
MGVDIGGTFTDVAVVDGDGRLHIGKTLTTPRREEEGVVRSIAHSGTEMSDVDVLVHGTTLVINALVERRGAKVALVTTRGFRDIYLMGLSNRPDNFNIFYQRDEPMVPRHLIFEVDERISPSGQTLTPITDGGVSNLVDELRTAGVEAVAVALLNSYANPAHEEELAVRLADELPGVYITTSSAISQVWREYERTSTAVSNSYVGPVIERYTAAIEASLDSLDFRGSFVFLDSSGGGLSVPSVRRLPIRLLESGPVGGVLGTRDLTRELGIDYAVSFDMGGTTAKGSLIEFGSFDSTELSYPVGYRTGFPVQAPCVDIMEVGAGGGSIAWVDDSGRLRVGPRSAGAEPGPACYGNGGTELTVTDANVYLGRMQPDFFLGSIEIQPELAAGAVERLAQQLDMEPRRLALGVLRLANLSMAEVVRQQTVVRGRDPRGYAMFGFGGAGPMHACEVAVEAGISRVIIPTSPGHFSALGMLQADISFDRASVVDERLDTLDFDSMNAHLRTIGDELAAIVDADAVSSGQPMFEFSLALRYEGQEHTLRVAAPRGDLRIEPMDVTHFREKFEAEHRTRYRHDHPDSAVEVVAVYATARRPLPQVKILPPERTGHIERAERTVHFTNDGGVPAAFVARTTLSVGDTLTGPAVIYEEGSNIVIPPGAVVTVIDRGHLSIDLAGVRF